MKNLPQITCFSTKNLPYVNLQSNFFNDVLRVENLTTIIPTLNSKDSNLLQSETSNVTISYTFPLIQLNTYHYCSSFKFMHVIHLIPYLSLINLFSSNNSSIPNILLLYLSPICR